MNTFKMVAAGATLLALSTSGLAHALPLVTDGLVAAYEFNGNANDATANQLHGTMQGGVSSTSDRYGNQDSAFLFDGRSGHIRIGNTPLLDLPGVGTISVWFNHSFNSNDPNNVLVNKYRSDTANEAGYTMAVNQVAGQNQVVGWVKDNQGGVTDKTHADNIIPTVLSGQWTHYAFVIANNQVDQYIDGQFIDYPHENDLPTLTGNNIDLLIGAGMASSGMVYNHFSGAIDDVYFYNRALTATEIETLHSGQTPVPEPTTLLLFGTGLACLAAAGRKKQ